LPIILRDVNKIFLDKASLLLNPSTTTTLEIAVRAYRHNLRTSRRDVHPQVIALVDTVSEMKEIKHAYQKANESQPGINYLKRG
jgi:hypothetical protein